MKKVFKHMEYLYKYRYYKNKLKKAMKIIDELEKDNKFLVDENSILKSRLRKKINKNSL